MSVDVDSGGGKGHRKKLNADLNVVPFIDLLSCCISFLLITAVWVQFSSIKISTSNKSDVADSGKTDAPKKIDKLKITVTEKGYELNIGEKKDQISKQATTYNYDELHNYLKKIESTPIPVIIAGENTIFYEEIIRVMDIARSHSLMDVSISIKEPESINKKDS